VSTYIRSFTFPISDGVPVISSQLNLYGGAAVVVVVVVVLDVLVVVLVDVDVVVVVGQLVGMSIQFSHVPTEHTLMIVAPTGSSTIYPAVKLAAGTCVSKGAVYPFASEYKSNGPAEPPGGIVMFICINIS